MIGNHRITLTLAFMSGFALFAPAGEGGGLFHRKTRLDSARSVNWSMSSAPISDEKKRKAAIRELNDADPRVQVEVIPILVAALRKDSSETVRSSAAEAIGRYSVVFPLADWRWRTQPSPTVRPRFGPRRGKHYGNTIYWVIAAQGR